MAYPLEELGFARFLVEGEDGTILFEEGRARSNDGSTSLSDLPRVVYQEEGAAASTEAVAVTADRPAAIDLRLLSRTLHPTFSDHSLPAICRHYNITFSDEEAQQAVGALFPALLADAIRLDPELLALLSQLLPASTGDLMTRLISFAVQPAAAPPAQEKGDTPALLSAPPTVEEALAQDGPLAMGLTSFEDRSGQRDMAQRVCDLLEEGGTLVVEAGPGTGKTFAYLVPALLYLDDHPKERLILSTRTKQLQEQVYQKDLPFLTARLAPKIRIALLKGRTNYLCQRRWRIVLDETIEGLEQDLLPLLAPLASWLVRTDTGDIEENGAFFSDPRARKLWNRLYDDPHRCLGPACFHFDDCFSSLARRRARRADLVVVNHSLLLADQQSEQGIIGDYSSLIVDEAHALEGAARQAFTETLDQRALERLLREIEHPTGGRRTGGWLTRLPFPPTDTRALRIHDLQESLQGMNTRLFTELAASFPADLRGRLPKLDEFRPRIERLVQTAEELSKAIEAVGETLGTLTDTQEARREADGLSTDVERIACLFTVLFSPPAENTVHWYERYKGEILLHSSPLEVAPFLAERLYPKLEKFVLTSATLSLGGEFDYLDSSLGLSSAPGAATHAVAESPFCYEDRMRLYLPAYFPPVTGPLEESAEAIAACARTAADTTDRKILVLFTSYRLLRAVHQRLAPGGRVLAQGIDGPRSKLTARFKEEQGGMILLGTDSFWEGVDLPGSDLEILIITRLPFPVPTDPVFAALGERISAAGKDAFLDLSIPQAILKLRQGVGRLIRTNDDRGAVIITDQRIIKKRYGHLFSASLPVPGRQIRTTEDLLSDLGAWFSSG
ncbi:DEAD/DEAH box helicase [Candidatus Bipolaricaulota bacterium]|nr:DEAD/DEAH box helicase [Candidatus Bipolaricaulota bacterium]